MNADSIIFNPLDQSSKGTTISLLQGTIASNLICGLTGGPGLTAGGNFGPKYALFEPGTRNTGTDLVGRNKANPVAMLAASVQLLEHIGLNRSAEIIGKAIDSTVNKDKVHTEDLGGNASTQEVVDSILLNVQKEMSSYFFKDSDLEIIQ